MQSLREMVLECDLFSHTTLQRYRHGDSYSTVTGGIISILWVFLFVGMFATLTIDTFQNNIIFSQLTVNYDDDPVYSSVNTAPSHKFMFAIGLTGIDLSSS